MFNLLALSLQQCTVDELLNNKMHF